MHERRNSADTTLERFFMPTVPSFPYVTAEQYEAVTYLADLWQIPMVAITATSPQGRLSGTCKYVVHINDGSQIRLGTYAQLCKQSTWQRVICEQIQKRVHYSKDTWDTLCVTIVRAISYAEDTQESRTHTEIAGWFETYAAQIGTQADYNVIRQGLPFIAHRHYHVHLHHFLMHVKTRVTHVNRIGLGHMFRRAGWKRVDVRRTDKETGETTHAHYWKHKI